MFAIGLSLTQGGFRFLNAFLQELRFVWGQGQLGAGGPRRTRNRAVVAVSTMIHNGIAIIYLLCRHEARDFPVIPRQNRLESAKEHGFIRP